MQETVRWHTAAPLWPATLQNGQRAYFKRPAILRFAADTFMEDLEAQLNAAPEQLPDYVARQESWRDSQADWLGSDPFAQAGAFKLYQPAHGRFYLVAASLVCRIPGMPDKATDPANEQLFFVLRKLVVRPGYNQVDPADESSYDEYGWQNESWQVVANRQQLAETEERLPLFFTAFEQHRQPRRLLAGLIPVARRETYQAAPLNGQPVGSPPAEDPAIELLLGQFEATVANALDDLVTTINDVLNPAPPQPELSAGRARQILVFALLDLAEFLQDHVNAVWQKLPTGSGAGLSTAAQALLSSLKTTNIVSGVTWAAALVNVAGQEASIVAGQLDAIRLAIDPADSSQNLTLTEIRNAANSLNFSSGSSFYTNIETVLKNSTALTLPNDLENLKNLSQVDTQSEAQYIIRCVYERPSCVVEKLSSNLKTRLAPQQRLERIVSEPSPVFRLASFFDSDAPVRPVRITMPLDTSLEGLRKFPKNVSIMISDELQRQLQRIDGIKLGDLDDGNVGSDPGLSLGMICSLSIPIITICALILLMIIVQLLNIVFWWLPFFKICLPIPLKAK